MKLKQKKLIDFYFGGFLLFILKPIIFFVGKSLKRNHDLVIKDKICFLKLLGGGSLVIAYPALLSMKLAYPKTKFIIVTTEEIKPFVEILNIFDEILIIKDSSLILSSLKVLIRIFRVDTFIDFEVYSRLSTIFSVLTCARNRIGFYLDSSFWRKNIFTHLIYFNRYAGVYLFYEQIPQLFGIEIVSDEKCKDIFTKNFIQIKSDIKKIGLGFSCSALAKERQLSKEQWKIILDENIVKDEKNECYLLGSKSDAGFAEEIINFLQPIFKNVRFINLAGALNLKEAIKKLYNLDEFWSIDSGLLHFARLMNVKTMSFWGPTDPDILLKKFDFLKDEIVFYRKVFCSPCVHIVDALPCNGDNICIKNLIIEKKL